MKVLKRTGASTSGAAYKGFERLNTERPDMSRVLTIDERLRPYSLGQSISASVQMARLERRGNDGGEPSPDQIIEVFTAAGETFNRARIEDKVRARHPDAKRTEYDGRGFVYRDEKVEIKIGFDARDTVVYGSVQPIKRRRRNSRFS